MSFMYTSTRTDISHRAASRLHRGFDVFAHFPPCLRLDIAMLATLPSARFDVMPEMKH